MHVNRVLRGLREDGLLTFRNGQVTFNDFGRLVALADFDKAYLDQDGPLSQPPLAGFQEFLRPGVVEALCNPFLAAELSEAVLAAKAIQHDPDLVFR